jgi:hypothetical protein
VPEQLKISIRTTIKAKHARLSPAETAAEIERELARWRAATAPRAMPQALPIAPVASGPRVRVL